MTVDGMRVDLDNFYGGALDMSIAPALYPWIQSHPNNTRLLQVAEVMHKVYTVITGQSSLFKTDLREFRCRLAHPNRITLDIPGNAKSLDPEDAQLRLNTYTRMVPHNTNHPRDQLTLLAGMAAIHDLARNAGF